MGLDLLTFGEALVEVMRTGIGQPLNRPGMFTGPYPSGAPFIFAVQAARLGAKVGVIGSVGHDAFGQCLLDQLQTDNVDIRGMQILDSHTTGVAFVAYNPDGSRDFVFHARHAASGQLSPEMLNEQLFDGLRCLHIMGSTLSMHDEALKLGLRALEMAKSAGAKISFDPNLRPQLMNPERARYAFAPFLEAADILLPTEEEILLLCDAYHVEAGIQDLLEDHPGQLVIVTQGEQGCTRYRVADEYQRAGFPWMMSVKSIGGFSVQAVDPTGAGDCFDAGFLARWLAGDSPDDAARFANACGALAVTAQGPMTGARTLTEVQSFMQTSSQNDPNQYKE